MAFGFTAEVNDTDFSDTDTRASPEIAVSVGDLVIVGLASGGGSIAVSTVTDTAGNTYNAVGVALETGGSQLDYYYSVADSAHAANIITAVYAASRNERKGIIAAVFTPDGGDTVSYDNATATDESAWGTTIDTGIFSTTGDDEVAMAFVSTDSARTLANEQIGGVGSTEIYDGQYHHGWYNIFDATQTDIIADGDLSANVAYNTRVAAFKSVAGAVAAITVLATAYYNRIRSVSGD